MEFYSMSDKAIISELGERFRRLRLRKNISQEQLASRTLLSVSTIKLLEAGKAKLSTIIAVLRELEALGELELFIPKPEISPMQLSKSAGKARERASGERESAIDEDAEW